MLRRCRQHARAAAGTALAALSVMLFVTCVSAAEMTPEQKACCAAMNHDCGDMALEASCCPSEQKEHRSLAATKAATGAVSPAVVVTILTVPPVSMVLERGGWPVDRSSPKPRGVPTYVLVSTFRI